MNNEKQKIAIAEACGWRGQPVTQAWRHKSGFPRFWRSTPIDESEVYDFFSSSRISRVLLNPQNKPILRKVYCGILNNRDSYSMVPVVENFHNEDQYEPWPTVQQSLECFIDYLPDYLNDLNAMHEAEKVLLGDQRIIFLDELLDVLGLKLGPGGWDMDLYSVWLMTRATAAQRAEAFLRTLGKWEDDK